jgi:hypothetical protein
MLAVGSNPVTLVDKSTEVFASFAVVIAPSAIFDVGSNPVTLDVKSTAELASLAVVIAPSEIFAVETTPSVIVNEVAPVTSPVCVALVSKLPYKF